MLGLETVDDERDATAICAALQDCIGETESHLKALCSLLVNPGSAKVYRIFSEQALPLLHQIFIRRRSDVGKKDASNLLEILTLLVAYGHLPAFPDIADASRDPKFCSNYRWVSIFNQVNKEDPDFIRLVSLMVDPIPDDFARVAFLDWANEGCINSTISDHPFDSDAGEAALEKFLSNSDPEEFSYAVSAAVAIPFIHRSKRGSLLALSRDHPDPKVQLETAWALARMKLPNGIRDLSNATLDWRIGATARRYMEQLGLRDEIPPAALDRKHAAIAKMAEWLAHPQELGHYPDSLTILDQRELHWPATDRKELQTLLHWKLREEDGVSWTGSTTWALFSSAETNMPILDLYAMYNSWEMRKNEVLGAPESFSDLETGRDILVRANPTEAWEAKLPDFP